MLPIHVAAIAILYKMYTNYDYYNNSHILVPIGVKVNKPCANFLVCKL